MVISLYAELTKTFICPAKEIKYGQINKLLVTKDLPINNTNGHVFFI